jgi:DNA-3-methyladenine glycosylase
MRKLLTSSFFNRRTPLVAEELIGKFMVRSIGGRERAYMITETEAYDGPRDKACHAHRGKTLRNEIMFRDAGHMYVYFTYGMHWMLNLVTGPSEYPAAVLLRGVEGISGPARVTKALGINKELNGKLLGKKSGMWIEDRGVKIKPSRIFRGPRIGIRYAGEYWMNKKYRFLLKEEKKKGPRERS